MILILGTASLSRRAAKFHFDISVIAFNSRLLKEKWNRKEKHKSNSTEYVCNNEECFDRVCVWIA